MRKLRSREGPTILRHAQQLRNFYDGENISSEAPGYLG